MQNLGGKQSVLWAIGKLSMKGRLLTDLKYLCGTFNDWPKSSLAAAWVAVSSSSHVAASTSS